MSIHANLAPAHPELSNFAQSLHEQLQVRKEIVEDLAPRAAPHIDPIAWATFESNRIVITQIRAALERIDTGTYGACAHCGQQIPPARLEVVPYASTCVGCQEHTARPS